MTDTPDLRSRMNAPGDVVIPMLRIEGALALAAAVLAYRLAGGGAGVFILGFLLPDLAMVGYLRGPRVGALAYNVVHTYTAPAALAAGALGVGAHWLLLAALIWIAHIGFDRMLGYGLKHPDSFNATHLGRRGRRPRA